jgi:SnoaL-like domain
VEAHEFDRIAELFAEDIVLYSPIAFQPYHGREVVAKILNTLPEVFDDFAFQREIDAGNGEDHVLVFGARVGELSIQGCDLLHVDADGLIDKLTVMLRPLRAVLAFEQDMRVKFAATGGEARFTNG